MCLKVYVVCVFVFVSVTFIFLPLTSQDVNPELVESFLVTITEVRLVDEADRQGSSSDSPRTNPGNESVVIQIVENDNTRGILSFAETAVFVEESARFVSLEVVRTGGTFGDVGVAFVTNGILATGGGVDFGPESGTVNLEMNVRQAFIVVNITNDLEPELEEVNPICEIVLHMTE